MAKREIKPFMVTEEQINNYLFTKAQTTAYRALIKATTMCEKANLTLIAKQDNLFAYPNKFMDNWMNDTGFSVESNKRLKVPLLSGARISDSGADDTEFIKDKYIK